MHFNQKVDFYEFQQWAHAIERDSNVIVQSHSVNHFKMAVVKTSEVDAKPTPVRFVLSRVNRG
jgi:hypothetical protein